MPPFPYAFLREKSVFVEKRSRSSPLPRENTRDRSITRWLPQRGEKWKSPDRRLRDVSMRTAPSTLVAHDDDSRRWKRSPMREWSKGYGLERGGAERAAGKGSCS